MERDYAALLHPIIDPLVENPQAVMIRELPGSTKRDVTVVIVAEDEDTARLIGKHGTVANAIREVISIATRADETNQRIHIRFESFSDGQEEANEE